MGALTSCCASETRETVKASGSIQKTPEYIPEEE